MICTRTSMSALRIWGFERGDIDLQRARRAGWRRSDLIWERLMEAANLAWAEGHGARARRLFRLAGLIADARFDRGDPRRATAPGALAMIHARQGRPGAARRLRRRALRAWDGVDAFIATLEIRPRARSSLFHLRMEARHRETFHENLRTRLRAFAAETRETLQADGAPAAGHRHHGRWRGEKPGVFDDTRKLLAACLLLPDATPDADG